MRRLRLVAIAVWAMSAAGCESEPPQVCSAARLAAPLFGASADPLALELSEQNAVIALTESDQSARFGLCTGVLIDPHRVLTSRHCAELLPGMISAYVGPSIAEHVFDSPVLRFESHDTYDVAVALLDDAVPAELATPLAPMSEREKLAVGMLATLVGYGLTESGGAGERLFVEEPIVAIEPGSVTVDGDGRTGACVGDSGGPLLIRDEEGRHRIVGVLSKGSASCVGIDVYQRLEPLRAWLGAERCDQPFGPSVK